MSRVPLLARSWIVLAALTFSPCAARAQYVDTNASCVQCHENGLRRNDFCAAVSADTWLQDDKHRRAFQLLLETDPGDGRQAAEKQALVTRILGFELREAFEDERYQRLRRDEGAEVARKVATVKACLRCHATWPQEADAEYAHEPPAPLELGVSCQACHGPGEKWDAPHRLAAWRLVTPEGKAQLGFLDCRSTAGKAGLCNSCHVGDVAQGKLVKHEWYAAGHPPLPGFELASFQRQMPRHWNSLAEKGAFALRGPGAATTDESSPLSRQFETLKRAGVREQAIKSSYLEANDAGRVAAGQDPGRENAAAREVVIGGTAVMESYVRMVGQYASAAAAGRAAWPELALYDCGACHHELRGGLAQRNRPQRRTMPGRPPLQGWTLALVPLTAYQSAGNDRAPSGSIRLRAP